MEDWKDILGKALDSFKGTDSEEVSVIESSSSDESISSKKEIVHVFIEKKGRNGKTATIIEGFSCDDDQLKDIAKRIKTRIGTGGSARGGEILLQGDWKDRAKELLKEMGFKVKG
mgnify:CR=1 FL=1